MATPRPDEYFRKGVAALSTGRALEAERSFHTAITLASRDSIGPPAMRYFSYYGLSIALAHRPSDYAIRLCREAALRRPRDPELQYNLGQVYLMAGRRIEALKTFDRGLKSNPANNRLRSQLAKLDRRARPAIPFVGREHRLNRWLGRLRASLRRRREVLSPSANSRRL